ncbi:hypothetical protein EB796_003945 [Bugula neritina]|uniref:Disintegrin domain-containing protein n=1 Tax=Bugula neritina TaxID=10212 RepID=A0A7J7KJF6_BUGNE|nr:hypothetical protein EB796_003945 [Bugula neritina]
MHSSLNSEECDCGLEEDCNSKCCNPNTCRLYSNATCATGFCCDLETCTVRPISYPCRSVQDSQCDLPETCDGDSEWCPVDTYKHDGTECTNIEQGYCYGGKCNTHSSQCQFLWEGEKANDLCYTFFNNRSDERGNCGWSTITEESEQLTVQRRFHSCQTELDTLCGLLFCDMAVYKPRRITNVLLYQNRNFVYPNFCYLAAFDTGV